MTETLLKNHYLLEVGTEELPLAFLLSAPIELKNQVQDLFEAQSIQSGKVITYGGPRRLVLIIEDLPSQQAERTLITKGPPTRIALQPDGSPTPAGHGFARKFNVDFSELKQETQDGETYMVLHQTLPKRQTKELLTELLPNLILHLSGSHFMAWNNHTVRFSRPIRWLVSLWNDAHLPLKIGPVESGIHSHGHRVMASEPISIQNALSYTSQMKESGAVLVDPYERRRSIWAQLEKAALSLNGRVCPDEDLLDTVTMLVEAPNVVVGHFEERFLEIPAEVITMVMKSHQRYFPVWKNEANQQLLPVFLCVSNGRVEAAETIRRGNEKVLTARLEDARFFYQDDQKTPLVERLDNLKGMTFQKGLGSLYEKSLRLEKLSLIIAKALGYDAAQQADVARAALLAKADLVTGMVFEFTELQGVMGSYYARLDGEKETVADGIFEHYLPRFPGDRVAKSEIGIVVSLAEKLDTLVAVFSQRNAKLPSGSKDPLGLRRQASGVIQTMIENNLRLDLVALMLAAYQELLESVPDNRQFEDERTTVEAVTTFILQRWRGLLIEQDNRYDLIDAVFQAGQSALSDMMDVLIRLSDLKKILLNEEAFKKLYEPANRISKILGSHYLSEVTPSDVHVQHFRDDSENILWNKALVLWKEFGPEKFQPGSLSQADQAEKDNSVGQTLSTNNYEPFIAGLMALNDPIALFFEKVMVNDPDDTVRKNRYNFLSLLNRFYLQLACFQKLVV